MHEDCRAQAGRAVGFAAPPTNGWRVASSGSAHVAMRPGEWLDRQHVTFSQAPPPAREHRGVRRVALAVGALVWRIIGALLRDGPPPLLRFTIRGALLATGLVLAYQLWGAWGFWDSPRPPSWKEVAFLVLGQVLALGLTAVPAAVLWWKLGVRPAAAEFATASHD